jgi:hypothetical protein
MALSEEAKEIIGTSVSDNDPRLKRLESVRALIPNPKVDLTELNGEQQYMISLYRTLNASGILPCPATLAMCETYQELSPCVDRKRVKEYLQGLIGIERGRATDLGPLGSSPSAPEMDQKPGILARARNWWKGGNDQ